MFLSIGFISITSFGQAPDGINYQAVIRKTSGALLVNSSVAIRVQIKQTSATGTVVFSERQTAITSAYGLVNLVIGQGTLLSGNFSTINWSTGNYWVSLGVDFSNGTNYVDYGSQKLMNQNEADMKRIKIEDLLIMNIRVIRIGDEEAITLSNEILENT